MYQCSKKPVTYKEYCCFDHFHVPAHSLFTFDVSWDSLGTSIFGNSRPASSNAGSSLPSRLSFRFLWLCSYQWFSSLWCSHSYVTFLCYGPHLRCLYHYDLLLSLLFDEHFLPNYRQCKLVQDISNLNHDYVQSQVCLWYWNNWSVYYFWALLLSWCYLEVLC